MANKEIILTPEGRQKLVEELEYREGEKHDEIVERIKEARGFGDLSENAEYDAAKEEQSQNESRVNEIRQILATAKVVEASDDAHISVSIGTTVEVEDKKGKTSFTIVGTTETDSINHRISNESPLGSQPPHLQRVAAGLRPHRPRGGRQGRVHDPHGQEALLQDHQHQPLVALISHCGALRPRSFRGHRAFLRLRGYD